MTIDEAIRNLESMSEREAADIDAPSIIALLRSMKPSIGIPHGEDEYVVEWRSNDGAISYEIDSADSAQEYDAITGGYDDEPDHQTAVRYIPISALFPRS